MPSIRALFPKMRPRPAPRATVINQRPLSPCCRIPTDRETQRSRGFGFVTMETPEEAKAAIEGLNNQEFQGRTLRVNEAQPQGAGGGGGGGARRYG
jgi:hypothetical protein